MLLKVESVDPADFINKESLLSYFLSSDDLFMKLNRRGSYLPSFIFSNLYSSSIRLEIPLISSSHKFFNPRADIGSSFLGGQ